MKRKIFQDGTAKNIWHSSVSCPNVASITSFLIQASVPRSSEHFSAFSLTIHCHEDIKLNVPYKTSSLMERNLCGSGAAAGRCASPWRSNTTCRAVVAGAGSQAQERQRGQQRTVGEHVSRKGNRYDPRTPF